MLRLFRSRFLSLAVPAICLAVSPPLRAATLFPAAVPGEIKEEAELGEGVGALEQKDYLKAIGIFTRKADEGNPAALFALGFIHQQGLGVEPSVIASEVFYRKAAARGNVPAMYNLAGLLLARPEGVEEGKKWLLKAAESGSGRAAFALGRFIADGPEAKERAAEAESWFRKAAQTPEMKGEASFTLAVFLNPSLTGDDERARESRKFLEIAAESGYRPAVLALSDALLRSKDKDGGARAVELLKRGDAEGFAEATFRLAALHDEGRVLPKNPAEALRLYQKAAEAGHALACNQVAGFYEAGKHVPADPVKAWQWYLRSAELGLPIGQFNVGVCLEEGRGTEKDQAAACEWYYRAASAGYAPAQNRLAIRYQDGRGVLKDLVAARAWLREAARQGFEASILNYAAMLAAGQGGPPDVPAAVSLYKSLAVRNHPDALHALGLLVESGLAGKADPARAAALHQLAADRSAAAKARAGALDKVLSAEDKARAAEYVKNPRTLFE